MEPTRTTDYLGRDIHMPFAPEPRPRGAVLAGLVGIVPVALLAVAALSGVLGG